MAVGSRACVAVPGHPCFAWAGTIVASTPSGNSLGPLYRLRLDAPLPAEIRPGPRGAEVNRVLGLYAHEMKGAGGSARTAG